MSFEKIFVKVEKLRRHHGHGTAYRFVYVCLCGRMCVCVRK